MVRIKSSIPISKIRTPKNAKDFSKMKEVFEEMLHKEDHAGSPVVLPDELFFGVKRTSKVRKSTNKTDPTDVRLRVVPEETPTKKRRVDDDMDSDEGVTLLAGTNLTLKAKKKSKENKSSEEKSQKEEYEKIQRLRKLNRIYVWGDQVPAPIIEFSDLNQPDELKMNLDEFQIEDPTPIQMQAIPVMLDKRDLLACAPTGSGKTLAFIMPVILNFLKLKKSTRDRLYAIVLEPTRVLAHQTYTNCLKSCRNLPISCGFLDGNCFPANVNIVVSTPNRLIYSWKQSGFDKNRLKSLRWVIVDESDRLFDHFDTKENFKDQLDIIFAECEGSKYLKRAFFSATFSYELEEWCKKWLNDFVTVCIGMRNSANSNVEQRLVFAGCEQGKILDIRNLITKGLDPPALIFTSTRERAGQLYAELSSLFKGLPIQLMSSDLTDKERNLLIEQFRDGEIWILICTEMLSRGVDFPELNVVINFDLPTSVVEYIHRVGRTGRAGRKGLAITYFTERDMNIVRPIATVIHQAGFQVPEYTLKLNKVSKRNKKKLKKYAPKRETFGSVSKWQKIKKSKVKNEEFRPSVLKRKTPKKRNEDGPQESSKKNKKKQKRNIHS